MVLQSIRDRLHGIIAIFIFAILIIPFAFVGVSSYFTSGTVNAVAMVNDQEITLNDYNAAFQNYRRRMQAQMGSAFDPELLDQLVVRRQFLDQMINEELLEQVSMDAGLAVTDELLSAQIRSLGAFEVDGEFNVDVYQQRLAAQGISVPQFEADMRASLVMDQFPNAIGSSAIATRWEIEDYARLQDQQRSFAAVVIPAVEDVIAVIEEEAILAHYEENQGDYMSDEQVVIEYIELDAKLIGGEVEIEEDVLKARFEEQQARFISPESRLASHILIEVAPEAPQVEIETARKKAEELSQQILAGEDFASLATENSQDLGSAQAGGDLGWIEPGYMVQAFEDGLYELTLENAVSEPIQTRFGWHVIQLRDIRASEGMTFTEARDILVAEYQTEADERRFIEQADRLIDIIYEDPTTLDAAADELDLEVREAGPFGRAGGEGIAANREVIDAAFSDLVLGQGTVSDPVDLDVNHMVLILLKEHLPQDVIPLEDVREQVAAAVRQQRAMEAASVQAEATLARLQNGEALDVLATEQGLVVTADEAATRSAPGLHARLLRELFLMETPAEGSATTAVVELDSGFAVVRLDRVTDGTLAEDDLARNQAYARRIASASASDEAMGFIQMLRAQSTIEVFEDRLQ